MKRKIRYQAAILRERRILLIQHREHDGNRSYWLLPGGGREEGESEEECVLREVREETGLEVQIVKLLLDLPEPPGGGYERHKTYWCTPISGEARPGYEPEPEAAACYAISAVRWFDLNDEAAWDEGIGADPFTYPELKAIQDAVR
jgi:8-oxo-dGTP pyrophosphatase MutT (NUDIX family)